uniref:Uncharacterized protein n=1 Tax=Pyramimonas obovata TaxID=1411642 RepID=A0A7S0N3Y3_9CHLO|mmetsp:Transcript_20147/g.44126  ORF Transcript_20147/g.44126 Transcript_20147/m.44126 type:complete len:320 (+) Transcript_20147:63-1022(+)
MATDQYIMQTHNEAQFVSHMIGLPLCSSRGTPAVFLGFALVVLGFGLFRLQQQPEWAPSLGNSERVLGESSASRLAAAAVFSPTENIEDTAYALTLLKRMQSNAGGGELPTNIHGYRLVEGVYRDFPKPVSEDVVLGADTYRMALQTIDPPVNSFVEMASNPGEHYLGKIDYGYMIFPAGGKAHKQDASRPQVFLSSLLTAEGFRLGLLERFLQHYKNLEISRENMLLTINVNKKVSSTKLLQVVRIIEKYSDYYDVFIGEWSSEALTFHQIHKLAAATRFSDWIVNADSDEFHEIPTGSYPRFLLSCGQHKINVIRGI